MLDTFLTKFLPMAFATNGLKNSIPVADPAMFSNASYDKGFPQSTMKKVTEGGIPPQGKDFNGILNEISSHTVWTNAGGTYKFNGELSNAIGGYAKGAVLVADNLNFAVISLVNNNKINFNTNPSSISPNGPWRLWSDSETLDTIVPDLQRRMTKAENDILRIDDTKLILTANSTQSFFTLAPSKGGTGIMFCSTIINMAAEAKIEHTWTFPNGGFSSPPHVTSSIVYGGEPNWLLLASSQVGVFVESNQCVFGTVALSPEYTVLPASIGIYATAFGFVNAPRS